MFDELRFVVIEDRSDDRREVLNQLADLGFKKSNCLGVAETYEQAKSLIEEKAASIDVLFLDLNIPRNDLDGRPEKGHGRAILDLVHKDMNRRSRVDIRVIVVSGEDLQDGMQEQMLLELYKRTLIGVVNKAHLPVMLKANLRRLRRDPLRSRIHRCGLDVLDFYDVIFDPHQPVLERLKKARALGIRLVQNDVDYRNGRIGYTTDYADDLNGLIKDFIEARFNEDDKRQRWVRAARINSPGGWGSFLWRGFLVQHLYALNSYRNTLEHAPQQPFRNNTGDADEWQIPEDTLQQFESAQSIGKMLELIVNDLLEWYLPWHEKIYQEWQTTASFLTK